MEPLDRTLIGYDPLPTTLVEDKGNLFLIISKDIIFSFLLNSHND